METLYSIINNPKVAEFVKRDKVISTISVATSTILLFSLIRSLKKEKKSITGTIPIPMPSPCLPYVGHMFSLGPLPGRKFMEWHKELGPIVQLKMGVQTWILVDNPTLAHQIFVSNGADTSYRRHTVFTTEFYSKDGLGLIFAQPGANLKKNRSAALQLLSPRNITDFDAIQFESKELVDRLINATEEKGSISPIQQLALTSFNTIFRMGFGKRFESVDDPEVIKIVTMIETMLRATGPKYNIPDFLPIFRVFTDRGGHHKKMHNYISEVRDPVVGGLVRNAMKQEEPNIVKLLDEEEGMTEDEKIVFMSDMLAAGTDTISVTLSWTFAILCNYPDTQKRICEEIDGFVNTHGRLPTFKDRNELPFSISVMKECMRFRPTTPFGLPHTTVKDLVIEGYFIPKGATIISPMESMHGRVGNHFEDADKFVPERFLNNIKTMQSAANGKLEERDHFNFGWGRRICPGIYLAEIEIFSTFVELFSRCEIKPLNESSYPDIVNARYGGVTVLPMEYEIKVVKRSNALI